MNVQKVKIINKWALDDESKDEHIEALIDHYKGVAEEYCHRSFLEDAPHGVEQFIAKSIARDFTQQQGITSRSMGSVSYSFDAEADSKLYTLLKQYRRVNWGGSYVH